jgi:hypothetical protein
MDLSGPRLDKMVERLRVKYFDERLRLINILQGGGPYGTIRLTPEEQLERYGEMMPQDYVALINNLNIKYLGQPNAVDLVNQDLAAFIRRMIVLQTTQGGNLNGTV